jgi:hypothetical protein
MYSAGTTPSNTFEEALSTESDGKVNLKPCESDCNSIRDTELTSLFWQATWT